MIYAYIYQGKYQQEEEQPEFYIDFYGDWCVKEEFLWEGILSRYIQFWIKWAHTKRETLIKYLAERWFTPWGDNIFYKKWFFEKFF